MKKQNIFRFRLNIFRFVNLRPVTIPVGNETWYATKCGGSSVQINVNLTLNISSYKTISHDSPSQTAQKFSREQNTTLAFTRTNFAAIGV